MAETHLSAEHSGTRALRGVAGHLVARAAGRLSAAALSDTAVHAARKDLKKSRAAVRLLRDALGERAYRRENARLRDAAHALNAARDAKVLVQTLESLRRTHAGLREDPGVRRLARRLQTEQATLQRQLRQRPVPLRQACVALRRVRRRSRHWQVGRHGWSVLGPAFRRIYRSGRRAVPTARPRPADPALHEWRKRVKYLRYALQMLTPMQPQRLPALARQAESLTDSLGEAHDLALLAQQATRLARTERWDLQHLLRVIDQHHRRLTVDALVTGERLYRARPRDLNRQLGRYWRRWRRRPRQAQPLSRSRRPRAVPDLPDVRARGA